MAGSWRVTAPMLPQLAREFGVPLGDASLADTRDNETGAHIRHTQHYVRELARALRPHPHFSAFLTDEVIELLFKSAPLHDIGKVGIPDAILLKPGTLTAEEFEIMTTHTTLGRDALMTAEKRFDAPNSFLRFAREIAYSHQEKWCGSGYPERWMGDAIPNSARLMALADVYNALISSRVYKPPFSHEKAVAIISEGRNTHFDPDIVDAFMAISHRFREIAEQYAGDEDHHA
jgi:putative two-component system response regulator